jgi:hypothetical protein
VYKFLENLNWSMHLQKDKPVIICDCPLSKNSLSARCKFSTASKGTLVASSHGAILVVVVSLDEEEPRAPVTSNLNLVAVEAKALKTTFCQLSWSEAPNLLRRGWLWSVQRLKVLVVLAGKVPKLH